MKAKKYTLTPEHKEQLKPWADKWIANGLSTKPMDDYDRAQMRIAIKGLYESAGLTPPPDNRIVFVPSPFVARFAGGYAASIWYRRKNGNRKWATDAATDAATLDATAEATRAAIYAATDAAIDEATDAATDAATRAATYAATRAAIYAVTLDATDAATDAATYAATYAATDAATAEATHAATIEATRAAIYDATAEATRAAIYAATDAAIDEATDAATDAATRAAIYDATAEATRAAIYDATDAAIDEATDASDKYSPNWYSSTSGYIKAGMCLNVGKFGFECAARSWRMYQGGNFWSGWVAFLSFFRHVAKLNIDYSKFDHWEKATVHGSFRIMHPEFCMVSDRPRVLKMDDQGRPHCEDGPYMQWADGMGLYAWHGVRVPEQWIMDKKSLTPEIALKWGNMEQRRAACEIIGWAKILEQLNAVSIDRDEDPEIGELLEVDLPDSGKERFLKVQCGTGRVFAMPVPPEMKTALESNAWTYDIPQDLFKPEFRT